MSTTSTESRLPVTIAGREYWQATAVTGRVKLTLAGAYGKMYRKAVREEGYTGNYEEYLAWVSENDYATLTIGTYDVVFSPRGDNTIPLSALYDMEDADISNEDIAQVSVGMDRFFTKLNASEVKPPGRTPPSAKRKTPRKR